MKTIITILLLVFCSLQYRLWVGEGSFAEILLLKQKLAKQEQALTQLKEINNKLNAELSDLIYGTQAVEERARSELGMIAHDEVFYQILEK